MGKWTHLVIDVDYSPSDPGISNWSCDRTKYAWEDIRPGDNLRYEDSGGLFGAIKVLEKTDDSITIQYGQGTYTLEEGHSNADLDHDGRDYTNFYLNLWLESPQNEQES